MGLNTLIQACKSHVLIFQICVRDVWVNFEQYPSDLFICEEFVPLFLSCAFAFLPCNLSGAKFRDTLKS